MKRKHKCRWCGKTFYRKQKNTQYCSPKCRIEGTREKTRKRVQKHRKKYPHKQLGTSNIGQHKQTDDNKEENTVRKEKQRLQL